SGIGALRYQKNARSRSWATSSATEITCKDSRIKPWSRALDGASEAVVRCTCASWASSWSCRFNAAAKRSGRIRTCPGSRNSSAMPTKLGNADMTLLRPEVRQIVRRFYVGYKSVMGRFLAKFFAERYAIDTHAPNVRRPDAE